jgi:NAD(P)-dependent dehydrogenase (short-subunit alcohol dehydrogenase family)
MLLPQGKVIVVTGASAGLGRSIAVEAGRRGARVALIARRKNVLEKLRNTIKSDGGKAIAVATDVGNPQTVNRAFAKIMSEWSQVDILFNIAGIAEPFKRLQYITDTEFAASLNTNVLGVYLATREAVKRMLAQDTGGTIINITSGAAKKPYIGWSCYGSQKAAVDIFTRTVALETEHTFVRIAAISPGPFESRMQEILRGTEEYQFPAKDKFIKLYKNKQLPHSDTIAPMFLDIALSNWPELSGMVEDIRSEQFQKECLKHRIRIPDEIRKVEEE